MNEPLKPHSDQSILKPLLSLAIPAIGSGLFFVLFEIADLYWVGRLGTQAVAALSAASFFIWMLRALAQTIATGTLAVVSRRAGANNMDGVIQTVIDSLVGMLLFALMVMLVCLPLQESLFQLLGLENAVAELAHEYTTIFLFGLAVVYLTVNAEHVIRGMGNTTIPMLIMGASLLVNILLDPLFMFTFHMGFKGAALATVVSHTLACAAMIAAIPKLLPQIVHCRPHHTRRFMKRTFIPSVQIGAPIALSGVAFSMIYLVLSGLISHFGSKPLAALGIGHRIETVPFFIAWGFSIAVSTLVGRNLGAGHPHRAQKTVTASLIIGGGMLFILSLFMFLFAEQLSGLFIQDEDVIRHSASYLKWIACFETFLAFELILEGAFSGAGDTRPPLLIALPITLLRIPVSWFFGIYLGWGVQVIWFIISFTTFLKGTVLFLWFRRGKWKEKAV